MFLLKQFIVFFCLKQLLFEQGSFFSYEVKLIFFKNFNKIFLAQDIQGGESPTSCSNISDIISKKAHLAKKLSFLLKVYFYIKRVMIRKYVKNFGLP